jgi:hypothetical protein
MCIRSFSQNVSNFAQFLGEQDCTVTKMVLGMRPQDKNLLVGKIVDESIAWGER